MANDSAGLLPVGIGMFNDDGAVVERATGVGTVTLTVTCLPFTSETMTLAEPPLVPDFAVMVSVVPLAAAVTSDVLSLMAL